LWAHGAAAGRAGRTAKVDPGGPPVPYVRQPSVSEGATVSNVATVQSIYEAFGKGDTGAILAVLADDVAWESRADNTAVKAGIPTMMPRHGKAEVAKFLAVVGQMEVVDLQILNFMEGGNEVAVEFVFEANLPAWGGGHYRDEEMHLWTFNDEGKVVRLRHYTDTAKHIAAFERS
jgi:ketosteroid isomerase-like protein